MKTDKWEKLKFLFWRHLDGRQRVMALAHAGAVPPGTKPLPQVLELVVMRNARLDALWDAVMAYVPESKREANPFGQEAKK